jgi:aerobic-type carbon monoxide dehydrogenase small subunit (CoxS/CutS family)
MMSETEQKKASEDEIKAVSGHITRRAFFRDAGLAIGTPAISSMMASFPAQTAASAKVAQSAEVPHPIIRTTELLAGTTAAEFTVNGGKYKLTVEPHWTLCQVLRDEIGLTSIKDWCGGYGACGSCTVIVDGRPILSCMTLACECNGAKIETAEGIAKAKHPLVGAYIKYNAFQCGYCTPGFICTAKALLDRNRKPKESDVRDALGGNLCRCATYQQHPLAVLEAAKNMQEA